ncbi:hypothetical protein MSPP1_000076 [Malassezia sp. CBS 17886]|nr:hypothetical protein MSPP1_000076 [Malassezia sp. CBS 17886]
MVLGGPNITRFFSSQPSSPQGQHAEKRVPPTDDPQTRNLWQRHATRSRTRTRSRAHLRGAAERNAQTPAGWSRYTPEEHPLAPQNLAKRGYHSFTCLRVPFHVPTHYTFVRELGVGAYGCVALCYDSVLDRQVAIKRVSNVFGREVLTRRALREVATLQHLSSCRNITQLLEFDTTFVEFSEIYLVLTASDTDLSQIIRSKQTLTEAHIKYFMVQLLRAVHCMHKAHILHRDLKPGNLLVNADCSLRVCDFGMARAFFSTSSSDGMRPTPPSRSPGEGLDGPVASGLQDWILAESANDISALHSPHMLQVAGSHHPCTETNLSERPTFSEAPTPMGLDDEDQGVDSPELSVSTRQAIEFPGGPLTEYVATRWYRPPEVMLCFRQGYGPALDVWSVGCIFAELLGGKPIFPGKDYIEQLALIHGILGSPSEEVLAQIGSQRAKAHILSLPQRVATPWSRVFPNASPEALDLLSKMLVWDPSKRLTAGEALAHPWLKRYYQSSFAAQYVPSFSQFDDVEMIRTPGEFKDALQRQSAMLQARQVSANAIVGSGDPQEDSRVTTASTEMDDRASPTLPPHAEGGAAGAGSSAQSECMSDANLGLTYDWSPPSSPSPGSAGIQAVQVIGTDHPLRASPAVPEYTARGVKSGRTVTPTDESPDQKRLQRKRSEDFSILKRARAFINWA